MIGDFLFIIMPISISNNLPVEQEQDNCINYVIYYKKMEIADRINRIDRIQSNPVYPVNPVKRFD